MKTVFFGLPPKLMESVRFARETDTEYANMELLSLSWVGELESYLISTYFPFLNICLEFGA